MRSIHNCDLLKRRIKRLNISLYHKVWTTHESDRLKNALIVSQHSRFHSRKCLHFEITTKKMRENHISFRNSNSGARPLTFQPIRTRENRKSVSPRNWRARFLQWYVRLLTYVSVTQVLRQGTFMTRKWMAVDCKPFVGSRRWTWSQI